MQVEIPLVSTYRWGGRRLGAGRKPGPNPRMPHLRRPAFPGRHPSHVTLRVRSDVPSLRTVRLVRELERSLREACDQGRFRLVAYSIQSNHAHFLVEADGFVGKVVRWMDRRTTGYGPTFRSEATHLASGGRLANSRAVATRRDAGSTQRPDSSSRLSRGRCNSSATQATG